MKNCSFCANFKKKKNGGGGGVRGVGLGLGGQGG